MKGCYVKLLSWKDDYGYGLYIWLSFFLKNIKLDNFIICMWCLNLIKYLWYFFINNIKIEVLCCFLV